MNGKRACLALTWFLLVGSPWPATADDGAPAGIRSDAWRLIVDQGRAGVLTTGTLGDDESPDYGWLLTTQKAWGDNRITLETRLIATAQRYVDLPAPADAISLTSGGWAVVGEFHGGGTRLLQFARLPHDIFDPAPPEAKASLPVAELVDQVSVRAEDEGSAPRWQDLCRPRLLEHEGRVYIVASARYGQTPDAGITWIAEARVDDRSLSARRIGQGVDPRIARHGSDFVCAVRNLRQNQTLTQAAPICLYRSPDLHTWAPMTEDVPNAAFHDYDLLADGGTLWLLGVADEDGPAARLFKLDARTGQWVAASSAVEVPSSSTKVQLLPSPATDGARPAVVYKSSDGFKRLPVSQ